MKKHILVAEDIEDLAELYCYQLESLGFDVTVAKNGLEAMELAPLLRPDLIIMDIRMPKMSGIEVLKAIRRDRLSCMPIVLSGMADKIFRQKCLKLGAKYVFDKGTELEEFLRVLGRTKKGRKRIA